MPESSYRSKARIFADILRAIAADRETKPTHILYKANLSYDRLTKYLGMLEANGLISKNSEGEKTSYSITDKGRYFLQEFRKVEDFTTAFGLRL